MSYRDLATCETCGTTAHKSTFVIYQDEMVLCRDAINCKVREDLRTELAKRNYELRNIPGVVGTIKVSRDGEILMDGHDHHNGKGLITALDGTRMTIQMGIYKAFPDIPMRYTPKW